MQPTQTITSARITAMPRPMPKGMLDPMPEVVVKLDNGEEEHSLFSFYPDEVMFYAREFIGKTVEEAGQLRHKKDVAYLRS